MIPEQQKEQSTGTGVFGRVFSIGKGVVSGVKGLFTSRSVSAIPKGTVGKEVLGATTLPLSNMGTHIVSDALAKTAELDVGTILTELPKKDAALFLTRFACSYLAYNKKSYGSSKLLQDPETVSWFDKFYGPECFRKWLGGVLASGVLANSASYIKSGLNTGICFALSLLYNDEKAMFNFISNDDSGNPSSWGTALVAASAVAVMGAIKTGILEHIENRYIQFYIGGEVQNRYEEMTKHLQSLPEDQQWAYLKEEVKKLGQGLNEVHVERLSQAIKDSLLPPDETQKNVPKIG